MYTNKLLRILVTLMLIILGVIADPGPDELVSNVPNYPTTFMQRVFAGYLQT